MSVDAVPEMLAHMWDTDGASGGPMDFRASQMNLILHFGLSTTEAEALDCFNRAINFAQTYPCRIVVLCPDEARKDNQSLLEGKLFSQCYIGGNMRDLCCCEALILGYSIDESDFLENQVSLWLESDLPIYHWFHRVPEARINENYVPFLKRCRRVLYDSSVDEHAYASVQWPESTRGSDLALARTLPVRQHVGQFLSSFAPEHLVKGLQAVEVSCSNGFLQMCQHLLTWQQSAIKHCFNNNNADAVDGPEFHLRPNDSRHPLGINIAWTYEDPGRSFRWQWRSDDRSGEVVMQDGSQKVSHSLHIEPLPEPTVLAEALFFG